MRESELKEREKTEMTGNVMKGKISTRNEREREMREKDV